MKISRGEGGVTLIELAVVMAIVGIMALFVAPAIGTWVENFRIKQAAREMSSDFQFAKMKAISLGRFCSVVFNEEIAGTQYAYVVFPDYDKDLVLDTADAGDLDGDGDQENETNDIFKLVLLTRNVAFDSSRGGGDGITILHNGNGQPAIAFNGHGLPKRAGGAFGAGTVYLKNTQSDKGRKVVISRAGRIRIEAYQP
jgi:prepilin-type N-terminal cleavage/methylation domain-containing protein